MELLESLRNPAWDSPFFKVLARNDTGSAVGHQAGVVIPKDLRAFLPGLKESGISASHPTTDRPLNALLFDGLSFRAKVVTRYQVQTWGGNRLKCQIVWPDPFGLAGAGNTSLIGFRSVIPSDQQ